MQSLEQKEQEQLIESFKQKLPNQNLNLYLISLLFAIGLHINWLIITFSILLCLSIFNVLNKHYKWIYIKTKNL